MVGRSDEDGRQLCHSSEQATNLIEDMVAVTKPLGAELGFRKAIQADLALRHDVNRRVKESLNAMGRLDILFSMAAGRNPQIQDLSLDANVSDEAWDRAYTMNVKSPLWLLHADTVVSVAGIDNSGSSLWVAVVGLTSRLAASSPGSIVDLPRDVAHRLLQQAETASAAPSTASPKPALIAKISVRNVLGAELAGPSN
ncbi:short chain dehydrogenase [Seiridium cupressi]